MKRRTTLAIAVVLGWLLDIGPASGDDTYPTELWPGSAEVAALNGTTDDETGLVYIEYGTDQLSTPPFIQQFDRVWHRLGRIVMQSAELRMVKTDTLEVGCFPGEFRLQGTDYHYAGQTDVAGADGVAFSDGDDTYYLWLDSTNALRMATDATGWPSDVATFIPLAEVTVVSSDITAIKDVRNRVRLATPWAGAGTDSTYFTLDQDNAGAGVNVEFRANRGSTAGDAALGWNESSDEWVAFSDRDVMTFGPLVGSIFRGTQTTGTAPFTIVSTTKVTNLNADRTDGISIGTLTAAGGAAYAHSTSEIRATAAGDSGDVLVSNGADAPAWQSLATAGIQAQDADLGALADLGDTGLIARTGAGTVAARTVTAGAGAAVSNGDGVSGNPTVSRVTTVEAHTSNDTLTAGEKYKLCSNEGATAKIELTLPTAAAGLDFAFVVQDADGLKIIAGADDTIRVAAGVTPAAGYIECTTIGNTVRLIAINATEWIAVSYVGTWTVSS